MKNTSFLERARLSLEGLTLGDSFGQTFFGNIDTVTAAIKQRKVQAPPWYLTDDSIMALGIFEILEKYGEIHQDALALTFARNYCKNPRRGYGGTAHSILRYISQGVDWRKASSQAFDGMGSFGNGGAMRVSPLGAYFSSQGFDKVAQQARLSAEVTHFHPEGQAGAIAVAIATAYVCSSSQKLTPSSARELFEVVLQYTPEGDTRAGIEKALSLPLTDSVETAVSALGNGSNISAPDTVPFCLWCAARHIDDFEEALWTTVSGLGDRDTTCAIVGGIVSTSTGIEKIPRQWLESRESLVDWV